MSIYNQLLNEYNLEKEKWDNGEEVNLLELMFLGYALDAVDIAKNNFKIELDFSEERVSGEITLPTNEFDENTIYDVRMIDIDDLTRYGFSEKFKNIVQQGFSQCGEYCGLKQNIRL